MIRPPLTDVENGLAPLRLGAGYDGERAPSPDEPLLDRVRGTVATGTVGLTDTPSGTSWATASSGYVRGLSPNDFAPIFPPERAGNLYRSSVNGTDPTRAWADIVSTEPSGQHTLTMYRAARVTLASVASFKGTESRGADWSDPTLSSFVRSASYTRYFAYMFQIRFDSECKRETFLYRSGGASLREAEDLRGLGQYLVDAGATLAVSVITLGDGAAANAAIDTSTCATDALEECARLVRRLDELVTRAGAAPRPTSFSASASGNGGWYFDAFTHAPKDYLLPPR